MPFLEWNDDDFPILRDESEQEDRESAEIDALDGLMISIRESSLQASIDYYTAADDGLPDVSDVITTARRFAEYLMNGE